MNLVTRLRHTANRNYQRFGKHIVEREYCEWTRPYLRPLRQPLGILALTAIAALLCGLFVAPQGIVVFGAVMAVIVIGCVWPWVGMRGVSCQLSFAAEHTEEGKPVEAELVVDNRWPWPVWGLAVEGGLHPGRQPDEQAAIAISRIGGWSRGHYCWSFTPSMRGCYPVSCPKLVTEFPFGLWKVQKPVEVSRKLIAWPLRFPLPPLTLPCGTHSWVGQPSECSAGNLGHRTTVREYRHGDSMRQIHWAKTALYDMLVSYEQEGLAISDATITLDTHPSLHPETGAHSTLEWSIRIVASVGDALLRQGVDVTVIAHSGRFQSSLHGNDRSAMLDWLAMLGTDESNSKKHGNRSCSSRALGALTLHITTDLSNSAGGDSIVLLTKSGHPSDARARSWMGVRQGADIPSQVRNGWRNGPRSLRYAK